jgi:hypothetical protein
MAKPQDIDMFAFTALPIRIDGKMVTAMSLQTPDRLDRMKQLQKVLHHLSTVVTQIKVDATMDGKGAVGGPTLFAPPQPNLTRQQVYEAVGTRIRQQAGDSYDAVLANATLEPSDLSRQPFWTTMYQALVLYNVLVTHSTSSLLLTARPMLLDLMTWYEGAVKTPSGPVQVPRPVYIPPEGPSPDDKKQDIKQVPEEKKQTSPVREAKSTQRQLVPEEGPVRAPEAPPFEPVGTEAPDLRLLTSAYAAVIQMQQWPGLEPDDVTPADTSPGKGASMGLLAVPVIVLVAGAVLLAARKRKRD